MRPFLATMLLAGALLSGDVPEVSAQEAVADTVERPFVRGGRGDRPYLAELAGRLALGGYAEAHLRYTREDGVTDDLGFEAKRFNLFFNSQISDFVRFGAELEFEDAGREIKLEFMTLDLLLHQAFAVRAGMILVPMGRFNLSHDSPRNPFTDRPFVSTDLLSVALSQPGLGAFGVIPLDGTARFTYEAYAINGFNEGILDDEEGVRLPSGRENFENNNRSLSISGRVAFSPDPNFEFGLSGLHGQYNVSHLEGEQIDDGRDVTIGALDWDADFGSVVVSGEASAVDIDIAPVLEGLFARGQWGAYTDIVVPFGAGFVSTMTRSRFEAKARLDFVDFDRHLRGDDRFRVSIGLNFRPTSDTVFKLDYFRGTSHDRFNNAAGQAGILFSAATYF